MTVQSAQKAATVESLSVLITPTLARQPPMTHFEGLHFLEAFDLDPTVPRRSW
jgi:hypothetical protein